MSAPRKRRVRGYLIDPRFQLKYTVTLVAVVLVVMAGLGLVIWRTSSVATGHARYAAAQAESALKESATSARLVKMSASSYAADVPELQKTLDEELAEIDRTYEKNLAEVGKRRLEVEQQQRRMLWILLGSGATLLVVLTMMGIFITHRIVGPVFRLKRLCRQVGTARFIVSDRPLRRGDELEDLFQTFVQMIWSLKALQSSRLATLDATIEKAQAAGTSTEVLEGLRVLRAQMTLGLGGVESLRGGSAPAATGGAS